MSHVLVISIMGDEEVLPPGLFDGAPEGQTDRDWIARRLTQAGLDRQLTLDYVDISLGDALPAVADYDGVVMGGSIHNANEQRPWQLRGIEWLLKWRDTRRPFFGICGGHQLAAVALGGSVEVMAPGPNATTERIDLSDAGRAHVLFEGCASSPRVHLGHYDHVVSKPVGSTVLASFENIVMALDLNDDWYTVQFHPEANANLMRLGWGEELELVNGTYDDEDHDGRRIIANFFTSTGLANTQETQ